MARNRRTTQQKEVQDYRHDTATRKNNPPPGIAAQGQIQETPKQQYAYNPHLPPNLRSDPNGDADKLPELLQIAQLYNIQEFTLSEFGLRPCQRIHTFVGVNTIGVIDETIAFQRRIVDF